MRNQARIVPHSRLHIRYFAFAGTPLLFALVALTALAAAEKKPKEQDAEKPKEARTIGSLTAVAGLDPVNVEGIGLIVGLADSGSDPAPGPDRTALLLEMQKREVKGAEEILRSRTTALVRIRAAIPPGVRSCQSAGCWCRTDKKRKSADAERQPLRLHKGDTFDVEVEVPPRDGTTSLEGGWLLEAWLYEVAAVRGAGVLPGHVLARASGPVLVASGFGSEHEKEQNLKRGRVLGGGVATKDRHFALITDNDRTARWTIQVASRISGRYHGKTRDGKPIAEAKSGQQVLLQIPLQYRQNIGRYLEVIGSMPVYQTEPAEAEWMKRLEAELLDRSTARSAAIKLEGIGVRAIGILKNGLTSSDPDVRFFSSEALAYLDEPAAAEVLADTARQIPEYRAHALTALCSLDESVSRLKLYELMGTGDSAELRYGAFRALRVLEDDPSSDDALVADQLYLHQIHSTGKPFVHVSSRGRAEIVLFGRDLKLQTPVHLNAGRSILLTAGTHLPQLQISRFDTGQATDREFCSLEIDDVIRRAMSMGATYPDVVGMLVHAKENRNLPGRLELDAIPDPILMASRLRKLTEAGQVPSENVATSNLFRRLDTKERGRTGRSSELDDRRTTDGEDVASTDSNDSAKSPKYLTKPTFWDRVLRRSAN